MAVSRAFDAHDSGVAPDADLGPMHHPKLSDVLTGEMSRLHNAGFWLVPLGLNRKPLVLMTKKDGTPTRRLPLSAVIEKMAGAGSSNYGIRLPGLLVVDIDTDTPEAHAYVERRFGASSVQVKSPKGVHHYYRFSGRRPKNVKLPGIVIDFKLGCQEHIAGPFAEREDGGQYLPLRGRLTNANALPVFADKEPAAAPTAAPVSLRNVEQQELIPPGVRNNMLCKAAIRYVSYSDTKDDLLADLLQYRNINFDEPSSVPDAEVAAVADWAFQLMLDGKVYQGRKSGVLIPRESIDKLAARGEGTALLLYSIIQADLGHKPNYEFSIVPDALKKSGKLNAGRRQIYDAIQVLVDEKLIDVSFYSSKPKVPHRYRLPGGREERGFNTYIDIPIGHKGITVYEGEADAPA